MASDAPKALNQLGQSLWLDNITRDLLDSGTLKRYIDELSVTGLTSNPTIFDHAISHSSRYDAEIRRQIDRGTTGEGLFFNLAIQDLSRAADLFLRGPCAHRHGGRFRIAGGVAAARLRHTGDGSAGQDAAHPGKQAQPFHQDPRHHGRPAGDRRKRSSPASRSTSPCCSPPNSTSAAADAYLKGLERRVAAGLSPDVRSVASLFVSRWDVAVAHQVPAELRNTLGIAVGKQTYQAYRDVLESDRFQRLANVGARPQRLLFASTGTKDKSASDTLYISGLAVPNTVNTMPEETLLAFADHGTTGSSLPRDGGDTAVAAAGAYQGRYRRDRIGGATAIRRRQRVRRFLA